MVMTLDALRELRDRAKDLWVLSVYIFAEEHDPAMRAAWRVRLQGLLDEQRSLVGDPHGQRAFDAARAHIEEALAPITGFLPGPGWAGFATAEGTLYTGLVPAPMPDYVAWRRGPSLAPYLRALKQARPVVVALADSRHARIFAYADGQAREVRDLRADQAVGDLTDVNVSKRAAAHTGIRGETGTDAAARIQEQGARRMLEMLENEVRRLAGHDGLVILGGPEETTAALRRELQSHFGDRLLEDSTLRFDMSEGQIAQAISGDASAVSRRLHDALVEEIIAAAAADGNGCVGRAPTERALRNAQVDVLALSTGFQKEHAALAEELVGLALDTGARVELVDGDGAQRLDDHGGVGARLRYQLRPATEV